MPDEFRQQFAVGDAVDVNAAVAAAGGEALALLVVGDGVDVLALRKLAETLARLQIPNGRLAVPIAGGDVNAVGGERGGVDRRHVLPRTIGQVAEITQTSPLPAAEFGRALGEQLSRAIEGTFVDLRLGQADARNVGGVFLGLFRLLGGNRRRLGLRPLFDGDDQILFGLSFGLHCTNRFILGAIARHFGLGKVLRRLALGDDGSISLRHRFIALRADGHERNGDDANHRRHERRHGAFQQFDAPLPRVAFSQPVAAVRPTSRDAIRAVRRAARRRDRSRPWRARASRSRRGPNRAARPRGGCRSTGRGLLATRRWSGRRARSPAALARSFKFP